MSRLLASPWSALSWGLSAGVWAVIALTGPVFGQDDRAGAPSLARLVPDANLAVYAEFEGVDAHSQAWKKSAAYKILNDTTMGALMKDLAVQGIDAARPAGGDRPNGAESVAALEHLLRKGGVLAFYSPPLPNPPHALLVFRGGDQGELRGVLDQFAAANSEPKGLKTSIEKRGRTITSYDQRDRGAAIWQEKGFIILAAATNVDTILDVIDGKQPSAETSVTRAALEKSEDGFETVGLAFVDMARFPPLPADAVRMGLDGLKRIDIHASASRDDALMTIVKLVAPGPRKGVLALLDQPTFDVSSLPPLPADLNGFTILSLDLAKTYDRVVALMKASDAAAAARIDQAEQAMNRALGVDVRHDLLDHLGSKLAIYAAPAAGAPAPPGAALFDLTVGVSIDDQKTVARAIEPLLEAVTRQLQAQAAKPGGQPGAVVAEIRKQDGPRPTWRLLHPPGQIPPGIEPTLVVGKNQLVLSARLSAAESALAFAEGDAARWAPKEAFVAMARRVPKDLVFLNVNDPRETFPQLVAALPAIVPAFTAGVTQSARQANPGAAAGPPPIQVQPALVPRPGDLARLLAPGSLSVNVGPEGISIVDREAFLSITNPGTVGVAIALLLPAVQAAREAARRAQCVNNLKQIGLAIHSYNSANAHLARSAITDKQGKPLLSWRVTLLPYMEEGRLYEQFHLDEPWDSPHNKVLLPLMPSQYACPSAVRAEPFLTNYRSIVGKSTFMSLDRDLTFADATDGIAFTLAVVETKDGVPWTKPDDLPFDPDPPSPLFGSGSFHVGGFDALFADGSVRFLKTSTPLATLRALITRDGGEDLKEGEF